MMFAASKLEDFTNFYLENNNKSVDSLEILNIKELDEYKNDNET